MLSVQLTLPETGLVWEISGVKGEDFITPGLSDSIVAVGWSLACLSARLASPAGRAAADASEGLLWQKEREVGSFQG